jgi:DNA-binding MarR family transcriptional regulator
MPGPEPSGKADDRVPLARVVVPDDAGIETMDRRSQPTFEPPSAESSTPSAVQDEIRQRRPFHSLGAEIAVGVLRTAAVLQRFYNQLVTKRGITIQQYNVLRILRGSGDEGLPTLVIRDRMVHEAPGITRLLDRLEQSGLVRRDRGASDRRQVFCFITEQGLALLTELDEGVNSADDAAVSMLTPAQQRELVTLLDAVRTGHSSGQ